MLSRGWKLLYSQFDSNDVELTYILFFSAKNPSCPFEEIWYNSQEAFK